MALTKDWRADSFNNRATGADPWFAYYGKVTPYELKHKLREKLIDSQVDFDHLQIGHLGRRVCVFVARGPQSTVLYDKTKGFPSSKLLAALILLGTK